MKNPFKTYGFWVKILAAALLITLGVWLIIDVNTGENFATFIVLMFTGLLAGIFSIIRLIPLMRFLKTGKGRLVCIVEISIQIALSIAMIFAAIMSIADKENQSEFANFVYKYYRFVIAFYIYTRVVSYFICTVLCKEETDKIQFWIHIGLLTLTCLICAVQFSGKTIAWIIAVIALCCAFIFIVDSGMGYNRYRKAIAKEREEQKKDQEEVVETEETPEVIEDPEDSEDYTIPMIDEEPEDTIHIQ